MTNLPQPTYDIDKKHINYEQKDWMHRYWCAKCEVYKTDSVPEYNYVCGECDCNGPLVHGWNHFCQVMLKPCMFATKGPKEICELATVGQTGAWAYDSRPEVIWLPIEDITSISIPFHLNAPHPLYLMKDRKPKHNDTVRVRLTKYSEYWQDATFLNEYQSHIGLHTKPVWSMDDGTKIEIAPVDIYTQV